MRKKIERDVIVKNNRWISALTALLLVFLTLFSGCGKKDEGESTKTTEEKSSSVSISEKEKESTDAENKEDGTTETTKETEPADEKDKNGKDESGSFFDGAVFVGDSVTLGLRNFVTSERNKGNECLGNAKFLTAGSMGYTNTLPKIGAENSIHPKYKGKETRIEDALALMKAEKVFIMLGMNDFCIYSLSDGIKNAEKCITKIKEKNPEIDIYIESVTPTLYDKGSFNNANIDKFNDGLKMLCKENDCTYVDIASVMKDSKGALIESYCSDPEGKGVHMANAGCRAWIKYFVENFSKEK